MVRFKSLKPKNQEKKKTITKTLITPLDKQRKKKFDLKKNKPRKKRSHSKNFKNPLINHFNADSHFIYDINEGESFLSSIKNKNLIKVNSKELANLNSIIEDIELNKES